MIGRWIVSRIRGAKVGRIPLSMSRSRDSKWWAGASMNFTSPRVTTDASTAAGGTWSTRADFLNRSGSGRVHRQKSCLGRVSGRLMKSRS
jgi:hypothetical protein